MEPKPKDLRKLKLGASGEDLACEYLESKGYKILIRNKRYPFGEADIIAEDGDFVVLVEVKTKRRVDQGAPEEMVNYFKQKKLLLLARALQKEYPNKNIRIDVVAIDKTLLDPKINHIVSAVEG